MIDSNPSLSTLAFPSLSMAASIEIIGNPSLSQCDAQSLAVQAGAPNWIWSNGPC